MNLEGQVLGGRYQLLEQLGSGAMGTVYRARHLELPVAYAVKVLSSDGPRQVERFLREARLAARVAHPGVVRVFDVGQDPEAGSYLVMELLRGETLHARMRRGPMGRALVIRLAVDLLAALGACHRIGLLHRDVKPSNVFLHHTAEGVGLKLLDFGVAKVPADDDEPLTGTGITLGTLAYMAPEQAQGARDVDERCDLFAVGAVLFRLLTGRSHAPTGSMQETIVSLLTGQYRTAPRSVDADLPQWLDAIVSRALSQRREDRYLSATAFSADLLHGWGAALPELSALEAAHGIAQETLFGAEDCDAIPTILAGPEARSPSRAQGPRRWASAPPAAAGLASADTHAERPTERDPTLPYPDGGAPRSLFQRTNPGGGFGLDQDPAEASSSVELLEEVLAPRAEGRPPVAGSGIPAGGRDGPAPGRGDRPPARRGAVVHRWFAAAGLMGAAAGVVLGAGLGKGSLSTSSDLVDAPPGMVALGGGEFTMGSTDDEIEAALEQCAQENRAPCPRHLYEREAPTVTVSLAPFSLDRDEITQGQVARWLNGLRDVQVKGDLILQGEQPIASLASEGGGLRLEGGRFVPGVGGDRAPAVNVTQLGAAAWCEAMGKRLPTEAEWAFAARGVVGRGWPWGEEPPSCEGVAFGHGLDGRCGADAQPPRVGTHAQDTTPEGVRDLGGSVMEWTADGFTPSLDQLCPGRRCRAPHLAPETTASIRGGTYLGEAVLLRAASRSRGDVAHAYGFVGFRCAVSGPEEVMP